MANKYLDDDGTLYFWQKIKNKFAPLASPTFTGTPTAPTASAGTNDTQIATTAFVAAAVTASGGEINQNAFSNVKVGNTTVAADTKTDTLELVAGSNVTLTPDSTNDKVTIAATDTKYTNFVGATSSTVGHNGLVPAPAQPNFYLKSDGSWSDIDESQLMVPYRGSASIALSSFGYQVAGEFDSITTQLGTYAKKTDISGMYKYKGSVASAANLPASPATGDVYNIESASTYGGAGANVAWNGSAWDSLGEIFQITAITNAEIDTIVAS